MEPALSLLEKKFIKRDMPILKSSGCYTNKPYYFNPTLLEDENVVLALHGGLWLEGEIIYPEHRIPVHATGTPCFMLSVFNDEKYAIQNHSLSWANAHEGGAGEAILITDTSVIKDGVTSPVLWDAAKPLTIPPTYSLAINYMGFKNMYNSIDSVSKFWEIKTHLRELFAHGKIDTTRKSSIFYVVK